MHSLGKLAILGGPLETWVDHITQKYWVHYIHSKRMVKGIKIFKIDLK